MPGTAMTGITQRRARLAVPLLHFVLCVFLLAGCSAPRDAVPLGGTLEVLSPDQTFIEAVSVGELPPGWEISGDMPEGALSIHAVDGYRAVTATPGATPFAVLRRTNASLLATPFLSWAWHAQSPSGGAHPVRIIVGLVDRSAKPDRAWWQMGGDTGTTRVIQMVWNETALGRGTVIGPRIEEGKPQSARYIARGGPEQAGRWRTDAVDLSLIHRQVWPNDNPATTDIRFIGIAVQAARPAANAPSPSMSFAAVRLMR